MAIEHPGFPTPEDERSAAQLHEAMRILAEIVKDRTFAGVPGSKPPADSGAVDRVGE